MKSGNERQPQVIVGLTLASVVSQVGCVTVAVVLGALVVGLGLDRFLETRPLFTVLFLLGSIPVSLYLLVRITLSAVAQLNPPSASRSTPDGSPVETPPETPPSKEA